MNKYEFYSSLPPDELLDDLKRWTSIAEITCKLNGRKNRVMLWSRHTTFGRERKPLTIFRGVVRSAENGSVLRGHYRPMISASVGFLLIPLVWSILLQSLNGVILFSLWWLATCGLDLWDNASERRRVIRMLRERYP